MAGRNEAIKARNGSPLRADLDTAKQRLGELAMENELLWDGDSKPWASTIK